MPPYASILFENNFNVKILVLFCLVTPPIIISGYSTGACLRTWWCRFVIMQSVSVRYALNHLHGSKTYFRRSCICLHDTFGRVYKNFSKVRSMMARTGTQSGEWITYRVFVNRNKKPSKIDQFETKTLKLRIFKRVCYYGLINLEIRGQN